MTERKIPEGIALACGSMLHPLYQWPINFSNVSHGVFRKLQQRNCSFWKQQFFSQKSLCMNTTLPCWLLWLPQTPIRALSCYFELISFLFSTHQFYTPTTSQPPSAVDTGVGPSSVTIFSEQKLPSNDPCSMHVGQKQQLWGSHVTGHPRVLSDTASSFIFSV